MKERSETPEEILVRYAEGPLQLETTLRDLAEADLDQALSAGSWSIRQIVHHLADGDDLWKLCIKIALGNSEGLFDLRWYWAREQVAWRESWQYVVRGIASSLALLGANRRQIAELVRPAGETWERSVRDVRSEGEKAHISIGAMVAIKARHMTAHIEESLAIRREKKV
jgi:hypothetical protein